MRAIEFLKEAEVAAKKKLGRAFNHLEDLVFFHGSSGTLEALAHVREIATEEGSQTVRMKWDGNPQIYWGRATRGGPLVLAGHNGWSRGAMTTSPEEVEDFIANKSGTPKTPEDKRARDQFAKQFASLYPLFDKATPRDFVGFVYADGLFLQQPQVDQQGVYTFCPNPKSKTCYHVRADSELGQRIASAQVMVVGHAFFPQFGMPDDEQKPMDDFSMFNGTAQLIVQGPVYNSSPVSVGSDKIAAVEAYLKQNAKGIDSFLQETPGLGDLKNILYTFVNQTAKAKQLANLNANNFFNWLATSKVSTNKQTKIKELAQLNQNALEAVFSLVTQIMELKDDVIQQIESGAQGEIWDTEGEGRVRYADKNKQFGNVKLVPRKRWTPT
jgi:hypothetical protein